MLAALLEASLSGYCMPIKQPTSYNHSPLVLCPHTCNQFCVAMLADFSKDWEIMGDISPISQMRILKGDYIIKKKHILLFCTEFKPKSG